ncbi:DUF6378 domain-containing protein [Oleispirillum naphthae]|uniref:DUF6378 domain-containing protein n=1 Tax=Oleispirillum naphthae TaxID=2838853 RepID=UPI0030823B90
MKAPAPPPRAVNTAVGICLAAADAVGGPRAETHGDILAGAEHLAALWTAYLNGRSVITPLDVPLMLIDLKRVRVLHGHHNPDDFVDISGYGGCGGEVAARLESGR